MGAQRLLRLLLRLVHLGHFFLGVLLVTYAGVCWGQHTWQQTHPTPFPPPANVTNATRGEAEPDQVPGGGPWFVGVTLAAGALLLLAGATGGVAVAAPAARRCLALHTALLGLTALLEAALFIALCADPALAFLPPDFTGRERTLAAWAGSHSARARGVVAGAFCLTTVTGVLGTVTARLATADEDSDDEEDAAAAAADAAEAQAAVPQRRRSLFPFFAAVSASEPLLPEPVSPARSYTQRMRDRYTGSPRTPPRPDARASPVRRLGTPE